jgi:hypothetical protein
VRDIRAILTRQDRDPLLPSRHIINALCGESAIDASWLYAALAKPDDRFVFERARPNGPSDLQATRPILVDFDLAPRERSRRR